MGKNNKNKNTKDSHKSSSTERKCKSANSKHGRKEKRIQQYEEDSLPSSSSLVDDGDRKILLNNFINIKNM